MTKPRIFIAIHYMEIGGAEISLVGLLQALDYQRVDVDLFVYSHQGELMRFIPPQVRLLPPVGSYAVIERPIAEALRRGHWLVAAGRMLARLRYQWARRRHRVAGEDGSIFQYVGATLSPIMPRIAPDVTYDLAISFLCPHHFVRDKVRARRKAAWIHTDYSTVHIDPRMALAEWGAYDSIVSISPNVTEAFCRVMPQLRSKIIEIENILSPQFVRSRADEFDARAELAEITPPDCVTLLSIGRYAHQKNFDNVADICAQLLEMIRLLSIGRYCEAKNYDNVPAIARAIIADHGIADLRWFIIGYGGDEDLIRRKIAEAGMQSHVILLGKRENPYPYIKACDIYVQPSRYEGKSVTVREAQMLCKPVVVTNYPTAPSQIHHRIDGIIAPLDNAGCARAIADFIADTPLQQRIINYLSTHDYGNEAEVNKIYHLLK
ncbi:MAG: glycosyltransferase [Muribaculaceae bacterium]